MPPRRSFGPNESAIDDSPETPAQNRVRSLIGRFSFGNLSQRRPSFSSRLRNSGEDGGAEPSTPRTERAPIPTMMHSVGEPYATPLPILSMIVLSITMLGEFLSANVSTPFVLFMVKGFGEFTDDADIAFWTGILVSTFFLTQFLTAILWATVADKQGRRFVLVVSLLGSAVTCVVFGTCTTLEQAICVRLLQGIFAGAVGVARGSVSFVTDPTNEGRAYAILGFCWGMGGVAGAIVGGSFERPAVKWPGVFEDTIFDKYPYLLPCAVAASVTLIGSILGCFLGPDGGPREGSIRLFEKPDHDAHPPIPEEESRPPTPVFDDHERNSLAGTIRKKFSGYFAKRVPDAPSPNGGSPIPQQPVRLDRTRTFSRTSRANGSAYGYAGSYRNRLASNATANLSVRRGSMASSLRRRRGSNVDGIRESATGDLNFAQRLLMANENAVTNIADLWVAAAMNVDNEDPFESDTEMGSDEERDSPDVFGDEEISETDLLTPTPGRRNSRAPSTTSPNFPRRPSAGTAIRPLRLGSPRRPSIPVRQPSFSQPSDGTPTSRRYSTGVPTIFAHPGVKTPTAVLDAQQLLMRSEAEADGLEPIIESRRASLHSPQPDLEAAMEAPPPSLFSQLPVVVIIQYGMLALHTTSHDQVFLSYLVTDYDAGGLNLDAGNFAQLIALMCLAQIAYQFYLYPNIGPPRGRFSHLSMFRIGSALFVPAYLVVILFRPFASASDDGNLALMSALAVTTALRYCGSTFAYTSVSILLNYMTPPNAVGLANGIAQSIVSLARCFGPVIGGYLWSISVQDNPGGYPLGFIICALYSFMIR
ncbi:major facilitator superfamily domain-containing protein [Mycena haematopus]|nr:major facilitator superfamily domain-containing protein [Mycena haematopus]